MLYVPENKVNDLNSIITAIENDYSDIVEDLMFLAETDNQFYFRYYYCGNSYLLKVTFFEHDDFYNSVCYEVETRQDVEGSHWFKV